jgi:DNA-binding transcriptional regulator YhcF (GntR family)
MIEISSDNKVPKVKQIVQQIIRDIEKGALKKDSKLPSINSFSSQYAVARDTIEKAYNVLRDQGYLVSVVGKGYYVKGRKDKRLNVLLIFNELTSYKKVLFDTFIETLGKNATVDLKLHHYNPEHLNSVLDKNLGHYHYYVVMPHFFHNSKRKDVIKVLNRIPKDELLLIDKGIPELGKQVMTVCQNFEEDIFTALVTAAGLLKKYNRIAVVFPTHTNYPLETIAGTKRFCNENGMDFSIVDNPEMEEIRKGTVYTVNAESDLAQLIKKMRQCNLKLGKDIGILSFNETVLKELLDITVVTTNFEQMGLLAAKMLLNKEYKQVQTPFHLIKRKSL